MHNGKILYIKSDGEFERIRGSKLKRDTKEEIDRFLSALIEVKRV